MKSRLAITLSLYKQKRTSSIMTFLALRQALVGCENILDVGCGTGYTIRELGVPRSTGLDAYAPYIEKARQLHTHDELVLGDVRELRQKFSPKSFDACIALDVIEHLQKPDGFKLMTEMEQIARKKVVLLTPSGFLPQGNTDTDDYQRHYSGWDPAEMESHGYKVYGLLGPKAWRGEYHRLIYKPAAFWAVASVVAHAVWTRWHPEQSAAMLCVKHL
jgi:SAM-dependent methyltransferase